MNKKALSIKQPWGSLIAHGIKDIENRTWKTNYRGRIYIHASVITAGELMALLTEEQLLRLPNYMFLTENYPISAIIGEVDIVDCVVNHTSIWAEKSKETVIDSSGASVVMKPDAIYNWVLANPVVYDRPILNIKGKLSFWEFNKMVNR